MDMNKVPATKVDRPSFANGVTTEERWAIDHTEEELAAITVKLQQMYDSKKLEDTRTTSSNVTVGDGQITSGLYKFIDLAAANEYITFISQYNPISIEVVS